MAQDLDAGDIVERRDHGRILRERRDQHQELRVCCSQLPVGEQLALVERGPLEDLPGHARRERVPARTVSGSMPMQPDYRPYRAWKCKGRVVAGVHGDHDAEE